MSFDEVNNHWLTPSAQRSRIMGAVGRTDTGPEMRLRRTLHALGYRYRVNFPLQVDQHTIKPDIVFTRRMIAIFVDGCFWHSCPVHGQTPKRNGTLWTAKFERNVVRDRKQTALLSDAGWKVVRIWEHEPLSAAVNTVEQAFRDAHP